MPLTEVTAYCVQACCWCVVAVGFVTGESVVVVDDDDDDDYS